MNFGFNEEQELLRSTARKFFENECPSEVVRTLMDTPGGHRRPRSGRSSPSRAGLGLIYPEAYDGMGLGLVDLVVLMEEMGRAVVPGPVLLDRLARRAGRPRGGQRGAEEGVAAEDRGGRQARDARLDGAERDARTGGRDARRRSRRRGRFTLNGTKLFVPDAHTADAIVVAARTGPGGADGAGVSLFLVPRDTRGARGQAAAHDGPDAQALRGDAAPTSRSAPTRCSARRGRAGRRSRRVLDRATRGLCAEMCGGAQKVLDMTVEYAKIRQAFGRPIGSYQGVKHKAADMLVDVENSKSITYYAAWAMDEALAEGPLAVSMAKAYVSDAYRRVSAAGIQLHGGIGFTWEHDLHLYFKRAKGSEFTFGDATYHRERVAQLVNL